MQLLQYSINIRVLPYTPRGKEWIISVWQTNRLSTLGPKENTLSNRSTDSWSWAKLKTNFKIFHLHFYDETGAGVSRIYLDKGFLLELSPTPLNSYPAVKHGEIWQGEIRGVKALWVHFHKPHGVSYRGAWSGSKLHSCLRYLKKGRGFRIWFHM